jgi:hypothetical protein
MSASTYDGRGMIGNHVANGQSGVGEQHICLAVFFAPRHLTVDVQHAPVQKKIRK